MCYDIKASIETQVSKAKKKGDAGVMKKIFGELLSLTDLPLYHVSGFNHPKMLIYTSQMLDIPSVATWGLVPQWVMGEEQKKKIWNNTLNARGETIFEKPSFRESAQNNRCVIYIDGFYEHHHFNKKTYPYFIQHIDEKPLALAGLWSEYECEKTNIKTKTFSIVTTTGNSMMAKIHNNPKIIEPRMPLMLSDKEENQWLNPINKNADKQAIQELIKSYPDNLLKSHTVGKLRGKQYAGNIEKITNKVLYQELEFKRTQTKLKF